jgi:phosphoglycerate dehydrogenase-like enzyme
MDIFMNNRHATLFITHRGERHQQSALASAPDELDITIRRSPSKEEIISLLPGKEFLISERSGQIDADIIKAGKDLRLIQRLGSMTYDIDLQAAKKAGIPVSFLPVQTCILVAEHMLMQILACTKRVREMMSITLSAEGFGSEAKLCDEDYFAYNWSKRLGIRGMWGSTVGILGFGEIGAEVARRLSGYGCKVLYNKRNRLPETAEKEMNIQYAAWDDLLSASDIVCMLLPFFPETAQSLSDKFFSQMKTGAIFVSCGGSGVVDEFALKKAIESGHLYGAALDTFTYEPIARDDPLLSLAQNPMMNLILTPHTAAGTGSIGVAPGDERLGDYINLIRVLNGGKIIGQLV